jgi:NAD(P)-dependent dehydrogenase (short-subunit alcohol dehydrogenase family)
MSKVWFITGAGSGIGSGTAKAALRSGDRVVATGRNFEKVRNVYPDVAQENIAFVQLDVANETQAKAAVDEAMKRFGRIDVLVNNAGYSLLGNFEQMTTAEMQQQFATNLYGVVHLMHAVLPVMRQQRSGRIINISSVAGVVGLKHCAAYGATKFAVEGGRGRSGEVRHQDYRRRTRLLPDGPARRAQHPMGQQGHRGLRAGGKGQGHVVAISRHAARRPSEAG